MIEYSHAMTDSFLDKYVSRQTTFQPDGVAEEPEAVESYQCFGYLRGARDRALMLQLKKRNGNVLAIGYAWLEQAEFDRSEGITLHSSAGRCESSAAISTPSCTIRLFDAITRHRVPWIAESLSEIQLSRENEGIVIESIESL